MAGMKQNASSTDRPDTPLLPTRRDLLGFLEQHHVSPQQQAQVLSWTRRFAHAPPGTPLGERTAAHFPQFRDALLQEASTTPAQVEAAVDALRLLFRFLHAPPVSSAAPLETAHVTHQTPPGALGDEDARAFLEHLALEGNVAAAIQNQALNALVFLHRVVLNIELPADFGAVERAKRPGRLPTVFIRAEVRALLAQMDGTPRLVASLLYGGGLRLMECVRLRVKDVEPDAVFPPNLGGWGGRMGGTQRPVPRP